MHQVKHDNAWDNITRIRLWRVCCQLMQSAVVGEGGHVGWRSGMSCDLIMESVPYLSNVVLLLLKGEMPHIFVELC